MSLPDVLAAGVLASLNAYVLLGGADFGGGIWDLFARGPRQQAQRDLIANALAPIWEANHVWLILAVVLLFTCFPAAFAALSIALHIPLTLILVGIVLRGSAFVFRSYDSRRDSVQRRWGRVFAISSLITPIILGISVGAIASGAIGFAIWPDVSFTDRFVLPWLSPFTIGVAAMALSLFAFLAAVYLTVEAEQERELADDFRRRALGAAGALFVAAFATLAVAPGYAPRVAVLLMQSPVAMAAHVAITLSALVTVALLWTRRYRIARIAAATFVSMIFWGWGLAQYPYLIPPDFTIADSAAPQATLRLVLIALVAGVVLIIPAFLYLFRVFKGGLFRAGNGD